MVIGCNLCLENKSPFHNEIIHFFTHLVVYWSVPTRSMQPVSKHEEGGTGLVYADTSHRDVALKFWQLDDSDLEYR